MHSSKVISRVLRVLAAGLVTSAAATARAADYNVTTSGPFVSAVGESETFNGTTRGTLPPLLDVARLEGGSFRATYRFSQVTPQPGDNAFYELSPPSGMTSYELLDRNGVVVHRGSGPSEPVAIISNNTGGAPLMVDQVLLGSEGQAVTGLVLPAVLYRPAAEIGSHADFNIAGYVGGGVDYLTDLSIPTDAATYLAFPIAGRVFTVNLFFGDGDFGEQLAPYQLVSTELQYGITALAVTPVPEPAAVCLLLPAVFLLVRRRGARTHA